jgi:hypothetical protein
LFTTVNLFWPKRYKVIGEWRRLHNEELYNLCLPPIFSGNQIKKKEMSCACGKYWGEVHRKFRWENLRKRDLGIDARIMLKRIFKNCCRAWTGLLWLRIRTGGGLL